MLKTSPGGLMSREKLQRIARWTSGSVSLLIALLVPLGYGYLALSYETRILQERADDAANALSRIVYANPAQWQLQEPRLADLLTTANRRDPRLHLTLHPLDGSTLLSIGQPPAAPVLTARASLEDGDKVVGWLVTDLSMRPFLYSLAAVVFVALFIAILVHVALRTLPFGALERAMASLEESQRALQREVDEKDKALGALRKANDAIQYQALHDELTKLPNRAYFQRHLREQIDAFSERRHCANIAVILIDLNRFKEINDTLGHHMGDAVLRHAGQRIRDAVPADAFLARLGGDEFAVTLPSCGEGDAAHWAEVLSQVLVAPIIVDEYHLAISGSMGIAVFPIQGDTPSQLLRHADIAMYKAKHGGQPYCLYKPELDQRWPGELTLAAELRRALERKQLYLHFQPKICLSNGEIAGVEALLRWQHPEYGLVPPSTFVPFAEQGGMINQLTHFVLDAALRQQAEWERAGMAITMAINISAKNVQNERLPHQIRELAQRWGAKAERLVFEITESSLMLDPEQAKGVIEQLRDWGARIAVDDFGTGYSSLASLKRLAVDELKIDRSFVSDMHHDADGRAIVRSTIELAHSLNLVATAEGIEDESTLLLLKDYHCDYAQGFHLCKPADPAAAQAWASARRRA
jgi:diguanylate cyclase (GGDEF)-like protein